MLSPSEARGAQRADCLICLDVFSAGRVAAHYICSKIAQYRYYRQIRPEGLAKHIAVIDFELSVLPFFGFVDTVLNCVWTFILESCPMYNWPIMALEKNLDLGTWNS
jgi:hypothetical protein